MSATQLETTNWPEDYFSSARQFLHSAQLIGAHTESYQLASRGPANESLNIDVAALISPDDEHRIILVGGVHGVEGFLGAAVQLQYMKRLADSSLPDRTGIVMIHAANPWGYAHLRRVDENNVDVNRNFPKDDSSSKTLNLRYADLDPVINPRESLTGIGELVHWFSAAKLIITNSGIKPLFGPIAQGQYKFPKGLFFGGTSAGESCVHLQLLIKKYVSNVQRVSVLDVHSGLGRSSDAMLIGHCNYPHCRDGLHWLETQLEQDITRDSNEGNAYNATGTFARWCYSVMNHKQLLFLCIEIGTVNPIKVFSALRRENQAHHWCSSESKSFIYTKQTLREVFSPSSNQWRARSVAHAMTIIDRVVGLPSVAD